MREAVAIIGMAGRFPGAADVDELWRNLCTGVESIRDVTEREMLDAGVDPAELTRPRLVRRRGILDGSDRFDAPFFGYTPREATVMDPQQRLMLECGHAALEHAGYDPRRFDGAIGVFASVSLNRYLLEWMRCDPAAAAELDDLDLLLGGDKDFLATRLAYKLDLRGPCMAIQTACSSSLVAIAQAFTQLVCHGCDMALAGGVTAWSPTHAGYVHQQGGILSPDGHCRAFDAQAAGTVPGSGVGLVVLKRLSDARRDNDTVYAVIRGVGLNNDGADKVGFTAPSIAGQSQAIAAAQAMAGVEPHQIGYVEAHGTGTQLGDPIEIAALNDAFAAAAPRRCAIGSIKTNLGHLDAAAGVAGLIKAALMLHHRELVPSLHYTAPNPQIPFADGPFEVNTRHRPWESPPDRSRWAGVSSFGMGGTNAHVVLEEAPPPVAAPAPTPVRPHEVLIVSAKTPAAAARMATRLAAHLRRARPALADVAFTLQVGRAAMTHRLAVVAAEAAEAADALDRAAAGPIASPAAAPRIIFAFPGQGSQHTAMLAGLYDHERLLRDEIDRCCELLTPHLGADLRAVMWDADKAALLERTEYAQPALFVTQYALAQLWRSWGVEPAAMIGHSIGQYAAAAVADVFDLEDALRLVAQRGRLMQSMPPGAMLAVAMAADEAQQRAGDGVTLAAVNSATGCTLAGTIEAVDRAEAALREAGASPRRLRTSHGFHCALMDGVLEPFERAVAGVTLRPPSIPLASNLTGALMTAAEATDAAMWALHVRRPVRFHEGLGAVLSPGPAVVLEVGSGATLTALARMGDPAPAAAIASCRHPRQTTPDTAALMRAVADLWAAGVEADWAAMHGGRPHRRIGLPTYPFEGKRHWFASGTPGTPGTAGTPAASSAVACPPRERRIEGCFYLPTWRQHETHDRPPHLDPGGRWVLVGDDDDDGGKTLAALECALTDAAQEVRRTPLRDAADAAGRLAETGGTLVVLGCDAMGAISIGRALLRGGGGRAIRWVLLSRGGYSVAGESLPDTQAPAAMAVARVAAHEAPGLRVRAIDLDDSNPGDGAAVLDAVWIEDDAGDTAALRCGRRFVRGFQPVRMPTRAAGRTLRVGGTFVLTGGLGGIGLALAGFLARRCAPANLVLVGRTGLPPRPAWARLARGEDRTACRIRAVEALEAAGARVDVAAADAADKAAMHALRRRVHRRFGPVHGIIHAAGIAPGGSLALKRDEDARRVLAAKADAASALSAAFADDPLDLVVYCSSLAPLLGVPGQSDYAAANALLDQMAQQAWQRGDRRVLSIDWDTWSRVGMAAWAPRDKRLGAAHEQALAEGLDTDEGVRAFERLLAAPWPQVAISTRDLTRRIAQGARPAQEDPSSPVAAVPAGDSRGEPRPPLAVAYAEPSDDLEQRIAQAWAHLLGMREVGIDDDFFQLGGHSLLAVQVMHRLEDQLGMSLGADALFAAPTVRALAARCRVAGDADGASTDGAGLDALKAVEAMTDQQVRAMLEQQLGASTQGATL